MEESLKRKERLQAMRIEATHNGTDEDGDSQLASGVLFNPLNESSPSTTDPQTPRFDFYTNPMAAFSGNKRKGNIPNSGSPSPHGSGPTANRSRISPLQHQSPSPVSNSTSPNSTAQQPMWQPNFHQGNMHPTATPLGAPVAGYGSASGSAGPQYCSSPLGFPNFTSGSPTSGSPFPRFNQTPNQDNFRQQPQLQSQQQQQQQQQQPPLPPSPHQQHNGSQGIQYGGSVGRGSPWCDARSRPAGRGSPWSESPRSSSPSSGGRGSPWVESRGTSSCSPSPGGRGIQWADPRGSPGGRGSPWINSRGRGGRGLGSSPSYNQGRGGGQGRGWRGHVSARERPELFYKKSMVEDPWKNLVPVIIDSLRTLRSCDAATRINDGIRPREDTPGSMQPNSISSKKPKSSEITYGSHSGPSLAESLALSLADAVGEGACD